MAAATHLPRSRATLMARGFRRRAAMEHRPGYITALGECGGPGRRHSAYAVLRRGFLARCDTAHFRSASSRSKLAEPAQIAGCRTMSPTSPMGKRKRGRASAANADAEPSCREYFWFFDLVTQNGGLRGLQLSDVRGFIALWGKDRADDAGSAPTGS